MSPEARQRLRRLADDLDPRLGHELTALIDSDSMAQHYLEVEARAQRAEDLVAELQRHLAALERRLYAQRPDLLRPSPEPERSLGLGDRLRRNETSCALGSQEIRDAVQRETNAVIRAGGPL